MLGSLFLRFRDVGFIGLLRDLKFWHYRFKYEVPSREEMTLLFTHKPKSYVTPRVLFTVVLYCSGLSLAEIGERMNCTRERSRQILWKAWRLARVGRSV